MARMAFPSTSSSSRSSNQWAGRDKKNSITKTTDIEVRDEGKGQLRKETIQDCMAVAGSFLLIMATGGAVNSVGLLQTHWETNQLKDYSPQAIGWISGVNLYLSLFLPVLAGPIFDRYGHIWLMAIGSIFFLLGIFLMSFFDNHSPPALTLGMMILSWGVLGGIGYGLVCTAVSGLLCLRFDRCRGLANGFSSLGNAIGGVMWPMMLRVTIESLGWAWSIRSISGLVFVLLAVGNGLVWDWSKIVPKKKLEPNPEKATPETPIPEKPIPEKPSASLGQCIREGVRCFRRGDFLWLTASLSIYQFVVMGVAGTLPSWGVASGFDRSLTFDIIAVVNAGSAGGRVLVCSMSDWIGRFNSVILAQVMGIIVAFGLFNNIGTSVGIFYVFAALWGFANGAILGLMAPLLGELCDAEEFGKYLSASSVVISIAGLVCIPLAAEMLGTLGPHTHVICFGTLFILSLMTMAMARVTFMNYSFKVWRKA